MITYLSIITKKFGADLKMRRLRLLSLLIYILVILSVLIFFPNSLLIRIPALLIFCVAFLLLNSYIRKSEAKKELQLQHAETLCMFPDIQIYFDQRQWYKFDEIDQSDMISEENKIRIKDWKDYFLLNAILEEKQRIDSEIIS